MLKAILKKKILLMSLFFCLSLILYPQSNADSKQKLLGRWTLEDVSVHNQEDSVPINPNNIDIEVYPDIEFTRNNLSFRYKGSSFINPYSFLGDDLICLTFTKSSFYAEWVILNNKLYIESSYDIKDPTGDKQIVVLLTYKRKN